MLQKLFKRIRLYFNPPIPEPPAPVRVVCRSCLRVKYYPGTKVCNCGGELCSCSVCIILIDKLERGVTDSRRLGLAEDFIFNSWSARDGASVV